MGLATDIATGEIPSIANYRASGGANQVTPQTPSLYIPEEETTVSPYHLYSSTGGLQTLFLTVSHTGGNVQSTAEYFETPTADSNLQFSAVLEKIATVFALTKADLAEVCHVKTRKTLYNWLSGDSEPRNRSLDRLFKLRLVAKDWEESGFSADKVQLRAPVLADDSVFDLLRAEVIDREKILFAGTRLLMDRGADVTFIDPFS